MREVNPGVKVNLRLVNPRVNLSMEQSALNETTPFCFVEQYVCVLYYFFTLECSYDLHS